MVMSLSILLYNPCPSRESSFAFYMPLMIKFLIVMQKTLQMQNISDEILKKEEWIVVSNKDLEEKYAIPSAFECYRKQIYRK